MPLTPSMGLHSIVKSQRAKLNEAFYRAMRRAADLCQQHFNDRGALEQILLNTLNEVPHCKYLYVLDAKGHQITANASAQGLLNAHFGRDRSERSYFREAVNFLNMLEGLRMDSAQLQIWPELTSGEVAHDFILSDAYISLKALRPSLSAFIFLRDNDGSLIGLLGADFALRDLPESGRIYTESRVVKAFSASTQSLSIVGMSKLDQNIDTILSVLEELILVRGIFHIKIHFTSSQTVIWSLDEPYKYRLLSVDDLINPDICLAYPKHDYPTDALVPQESVRTILHNLKTLRSVSGAFNLRSSSLNIFNGIVGLTFASQNSHYLPYEAFLHADQSLWNNL